MWFHFTNIKKRTWLLKAESLSFFPKVSNSSITISFRSDTVSFPRTNWTAFLFLASVCKSTVLDLMLMTKQIPWQWKDNQNLIAWKKYYNVISLCIFRNMQKHNSSNFQCTKLKQSRHNSCFCRFMWTFLIIYQPVEAAVVSIQNLPDLCHLEQGLLHQLEMQQVFSFCFSK